jgi:hypothetical protein
VSVTSTASVSSAPQVSNTNARLTPPVWDAPVVPVNSAAAQVML